VQPAVLGVVAEKQSAEVRSAAARIRPADHNEFLAIQALGLEPQATIARHLGLLEPFRDDALETHLASMLADARAIAHDVVGEVQSRNRQGEERMQALLAFDQRQRRSALASK
jgi:hypothetical protein